MKQVSGAAEGLVSGFYYPVTVTLLDSHHLSELMRKIPPLKSISRLMNHRLCLMHGEETEVFLTRLCWSSDSYSKTSTSRVSNKTEGVTPCKEKQRVTRCLQKVGKSSFTIPTCRDSGLFLVSSSAYRKIVLSSRWTQTPRMPEQSNDYRVVVFGAGGVGKSSLLLRFVKGTFRDTYIPTVEDTYTQVGGSMRRHLRRFRPFSYLFSLQVISCDKSVCTLQITDTTGSHQFPAMQRLSISKGHAFILVYSITSRQSLEELKPIYQQVRGYLSRESNQIKCKKKRGPKVEPWGTPHHKLDLTGI